MNGLTATDLLDITEQGEPLDWISRGLLLLSYAWPEATLSERSALSIGVRDRLVIALRLRTFGPDMEVRSRCRSCSVDLSARIDLAFLLGQYELEPFPIVSVEVDGQTLKFRFPSSEDLMAASSQPRERADWELFRRCLVSAEEPRSLAGFRQKAALAISEADPLAAIELELSCTQCDVSFPAPFDIVSCFWKEIQSGAQTFALEVHRIAAAYGWTEFEILSLSPGRRRRYLDLITQ
jgi:hypothetical protein